MIRGRGRGPSVIAEARMVVDTCAGMQLRMAERLVSRFLEAQLQKAGLSVAQFSLMAQIAAARDDTVNALAGRMGLDQSTLSRNLQALERQGLVEIVVAETDLRRRAVWLTEAGVHRLQAALPVWREAQAIIDDALDVTKIRRIATQAMTLGW